MIRNLKIEGLGGREGVCVGGPDWGEKRKRKGKGKGKSRLLAVLL